MIKKIMKFLIVATTIVTQMSQICHGQYLTGLVASSLGGSGRAAIEDGEQFLHNPASIIHASKFSSAMFYQDNVWGRHDRDRYYGITLSDNTEDLFAAGAFAFARRERNTPGLDWSENYFHASFGNGIARYIGMGMAFKLRDMESSVFSESEWNVDVGFHYNPREDFGLGLVFHNVLAESEDIPTEAASKDAIGLGVNWLYSSIFRMRADLVQQMESNPDHKIEIGGGIETLWARFWILRFGYLDSPLKDTSYVTAGFGFDGPRLKADYFFRQDTDNSEFSSHGVDLRLPFW